MRQVRATCSIFTLPANLSYLVNQLIGAISNNLVYERVFHLFHVHLYHHVVILLDIQVLHDLTQTTRRWLRCWILVGTNEVIIDVKYFLDTFGCVALFQISRRSTDTRVNLTAEGCYIAEITRALKAMYGVKLHWIILHNPAQTAVEIFDPQVNVYFTLVYGRIRGIDEVCEEKRSHLGTRRKAYKVNH